MHELIKLVLAMCSSTQEPNATKQGVSHHRNLLAQVPNHKPG